MIRPSFAIVGGADPRRREGTDKYDPPVDYDFAEKAAFQMGAELAKRRWGLVVYHSGDSFIEGEVVKGFVSAVDSEHKQCITILQPSTGAPGEFPEEVARPDLFTRKVDTSDEWEVSFYRSLATVDGLILVGGGWSTFTAGQVAIGSRIPILALARSGGSAKKVWKTLAPDVDLPTADEHARMADVLNDGAPARWADGLMGQRRRRYAVESKPIRRHAIWAGVMFAITVVAALGSQWSGQNPDAWRMMMLLLSTLMGGGSGAFIRMVFERRYGTGPLVTPSIWVTLALGAMAGGVSGLLYLAAQATTPQLTGDGSLRFVCIMASISVIGGLTVESVFRKLLGVDVVRTSAVAADNKE